MLKLLKKEIVLAMHPITPIMVLLSAMVLIPNYPYSVVYFYITLSLFFTCLLGRENNDVVYSLNLPIAKSDIVKARISFSVLVELVQMLLAIPFVILSQKINLKGNEAGMDANIAYFAVGFIIYGVFNFVFFIAYYKDAIKVGFSFLYSSVIVFLLIVVEVVSTYAVPFVRDYLDVKDPDYLSYKLIALAVGVVIYVVLTLLAYQISKVRFEKQDI